MINLTFKNMKNIFLSFCLLSSVSFMAQVNIGGTAVSSPSSSLEFGSDNKGIILPWVTAESDVTGAVNGTMVFDLTDYKIKVKKKTSGWTDLTRKAKSDVISGITNKNVDSSLQDALTDQPGAKVLIGGTPDTDTTPGILVLGDTNKAMILPKVSSPHLNIQSPEAGTIVYDTVKQQLAVFNGTVWSFWKAAP